MTTLPLLAASTVVTSGVAGSDIIKAAALLGGGLALAGMAVGAGIGDALVSGRTIEGVARQPEARGTLLGLTFLFIGLVDSFPVIGLVLALFIIFTKS
jgi:F-type H+-transporting ATPase subunit c